MRIENLREEYTLADLHRKDLAADPLDQFRTWFEQAMTAEVLEPTAMTLATADSDGRPSARVVLLKGFDAEGYVFFTNYDSRKGRELADNPRAALLFFWQPLQRQVRLEGLVERLPAADSDAYFASRPRGSRLSALASPQSQEVESRDHLARRFKDLSQHHAEAGVPRPDNWGGLRLRPDVYEFWQGRASRLHDRFLYRRNEHGRWRSVRLAP